MELFPPFPLEEWNDTKQTLHRFEQIVGKVRLHHSPRRNHWWNAPFHLTGSGITTRPMGLVDGNPVFTVDFDFVRHRLIATTIDGGEVSFPLQGHDVASFYLAFQSALDSLGVDGGVPDATPFDLPDHGRPFVKDTEHATYDPDHASAYWRILSRVNLILEEFAAGFSGKTSPVHHFWHTFDIAVTRFSSRVVPRPEEAGGVVREAYSREVVSSGFWFGDDKVPEPCFYSYTAPEPEGLTDRPLRPDAAEWVESGGGHLALYRYADAREEDDPRAAVLDFLESAYRAGATLAGWDVDALACPRGVTDPYQGGRSGV
ncbi:DUF5996 family protein [Nocardiopsis lambiniae]|uniref:DUF5996 family protein n=1 Tax=Nocardiopsis lambiniae TaxID=3075539 RepID=A0ABU2M359_9ACTN|nr:DUF5996 family protein [Nocardiopsis sp. DSM 44743]MDT0327075.1 DUF5996 family protein [Nocardiopsis sp. DSM 44743]